MKFRIPKENHIRWQAALAVIEDLQEDVDAPFTMKHYATYFTKWKKTNGCGTAACYAGYISVAPYCMALGLPYGRGSQVVSWLCPDQLESGPLWARLFAATIDAGTRTKTLAFLKRQLKQIFKDSTGKNLVAPLTFWYD